MASPTMADVMVRRDSASTYFVVDAATKAILLGPFADRSYADGVAESLAVKRGGHLVGGLYHDLGALALTLRETQSRVDQLLTECRKKAREIAAARRGDDEPAK